MSVNVDFVDPQTFDCDDTVGICVMSHAALPGPIEAHELRYVSKRLWNRMPKPGEAYMLLFAKVVEAAIDTEHIAVHCKSRIQELALLGDIFCDSALRYAIGVISTQIKRVTRESEFRLVLSRP